ncbi:hypothetical protein Bealeia1_01546 [Candidatus Bealeia paramacronuclearis]|uniref:Uncharacterized protein n=1 Tax=Candidatus Bealeia paramacronuclearis TaxID=1921001 RepID=A0ABZ2C4H3_9PROT|nr:hypothetical protein [Candidatus Bealeia paramacronuclearis]
MKHLFFLTTIILGIGFSISAQAEKMKFTFVNHSNYDVEVATENGHCWSSIKTIPFNLKIFKGHTVGPYSADTDTTLHCSVNESMSYFDFYSAAPVDLSQYHVGYAFHENYSGSFNWNTYDKFKNDGEGTPNHSVIQADFSSQYYKISTWDGYYVVTIILTNHKPSMQAGLPKGAQRKASILSKVLHKPPLGNPIINLR